MTATPALATRTALPAEERSLLPTPREGWSSLALLIVMILTVAIAVDDSNWAGAAHDRGRQTDFLPLGAVLSVVLGFVLAKSPLPAFAAHLAGAVAGAGFLLVSVAQAISDAPGLTERLRALNESTTIFYNDLIVLGIRSTETSVFLLVIGTLLWGLGLFAAFNLFRRGRATPGVLAAGLALLLNMSITIRGQYLHLILFSGAAMLLLVRMNLITQSSGWVARRIGDTGYVANRFLRNGAAFVGVTLAAALLLAGHASSAPLANAWRELDDQLLAVGTELNRWVGGVTGSARGPSGLFGSSQTIRGVWESSSDLVFRAETSDGQGRYWRGATYDLFDGFTWQQQDRARVDVPAGGDLLAGSPDASDAVGRREVSARVTSLGLAGGTILAPDVPLTVDRDAEVLLNGQGGPLLAIDLRDAIDPGDSYVVTALVPETDLEAGGITAADLAGAGVDYPSWTRRFIDIRPGSIGDEVYSTAQGIVSSLPAGARDPYHVAEAIQQYLYRDGGFTYQTDVRGLCGRERIADCLLITKVGYCEFFATTMTMLLRTQQIPARLAMGYLPGHQLANDSWQVDRSAAHAWVEVYFPTYGWVRFDPTPGNVENGQQPTRLPGDEPVDEPEGPLPSPDFNDDEPGDGNGGPADPGGQVRTDGLPPAPGAGAADGGPVAPVVLLAVLLLAAVLILIARARRLPSPEPDLAYRGMVRLAGRFGYGPKPTQTAYEYAGSLGEVLPRVRTELEVVARAKVVTTYARRAPDDEMLEQLRAAYRRVRIGLLRLVVRRKRRPGRVRELGHRAAERGQR